MGIRSSIYVHYIWNRHLALKDLSMYLQLAEKKAAHNFDLRF